MDRQQEFVMRTIEERDIRFIRLWFTDVVGTLKSVALAPAEVESAFEEGLGFDGSSIEGLSRVYESDMLLQPDPSTFQILPWRGAESHTSRMFCDILTPDGEASASDTRGVLKRTLNRAAEMGFTCYTSPEIEFYLLKSTELGADGFPVPVDYESYFDHTPGGIVQDFRRNAVTMLEEVGISVEFSHHETGPGQNEIDLRHADALQTADNVMTFRTVIKEVAFTRNMYATFMPKPFTKYAGSGMHISPCLRGTPTRSSRRVPNTGSQKRGGILLPGYSSMPPNSRRSPISSLTRISACGAAGKHPATFRGGTITGLRWCGFRCINQTRCSRPALNTAALTRPLTRTWRMR